MNPISEETIATFCCFSCKTKPLKIEASIPYTGYVPGQSIKVTIKIDNRCGFDVYRTKVSLKKVFTFISQTPEKRMWTDIKTLQKSVTDGAKNGKTVKNLGIVEVPNSALPTSNNLSNIVQISYLVQVSVDVVGFVQSTKVKLPVVIGSKPLKFEYKNYF